MMVSCPGCNTQYLVDDRKLPARGGKLTCRECGNQWKIVRRAGETAAPRTPASSPASPGPEAPQAADSSATLKRPVNCPKCGHYFVPDGPVPQATTAAAAPAREVHRQGRILLVEDQNYFAELTREALGEEFETVVASTLAEARGLIASGGFDLVILDLSLEEGQDGTQVLHATRDKEVPVLIFTARDETEMYGSAWDQLKAAGATDILIKGMNVGEELRQKVQSLLSRRRR